MSHLAPRTLHHRPASAAAACVDEPALLRRVAATGDPVAREEVLRRGLSLVHHIARRYEHRGVPYEDLVQTGSVGLINAVDTFDPARGTQFSTFAVPHIAGEIRRYFRDRTWGVRVTRRIQEDRVRLDRATDRLTAAKQRTPTVAELATATGLSLDATLEALRARECYALPSLDAPLTDGADGATRGDLVGRGDPGYDRVDARVTIAAASRFLQRRERLILILRFCDDLTQLEIAERLGLSQMHVSRLLAAALEELRRRTEPTSAAATG